MFLFYFFGVFLFLLQMDEESYRIIFLNSYSEPAREIICYVGLKFKFMYCNIISPACSLIDLINL